ncbi:cysteine proteinase inhibitor 5-like [Silene latifolia]|uniref:cysteine proteinase inhibitor 5-like n=1 Tax=Silene latifolia TaxID=37657 RepID=UPI003D76F696
MNSPSSIILFSFVLVIFLARASSIDGWEPVESITDPRLVDVARFAVLENNKMTGKSLELVKIKKGEYIVAKGVQYRLVLDAKAEGKAKSYQAHVFETGKIMELLSFVELLRN